MKKNSFTERRTGGRKGGKERALTEHSMTNLGEFLEILSWWIVKWVIKRSCENFIWWYEFATWKKEKRDSQFLSGVVHKLLVSKFKIKQNELREKKGREEKSLEKGREWQSAVDSSTAKTRSGVRESNVVMPEVSPTKQRGTSYREKTSPSLWLHFFFSFLIS